MKSKVTEKKWAVRNMMLQWLIKVLYLQLEIAQYTHSGVLWWHLHMYTVLAYINQPNGFLGVIFGTGRGLLWASLITPSFPTPQ